MASLLQRLGGRDAIEVVVVGLWERIAVDARLAPFFRGVSRVQYERRLAEYLCALLDDHPLVWRGRDMRGVHAELAIRDTDFDHFVGWLAATLEAAGVAGSLIEEVRVRVETVRVVIVSADEELLA